MSLSIILIFSPNCFFQARILHFTVQILSAILGAIAIAPVGFGSANATDPIQVSAASKQVSTKKSTMLAQSRVVQPTKVLYVNPIDGKDTENGSDRSPFKTITRALKVAQFSTTILLAPGTYSTETGEIFPLILRAGVTLQGDPATRGQEILIRGGGASSSKAWSQQSLTIEITSQATLNGVTVTNPNPQGYGVGIDSSNPLITNSTFTGNSHGLMIIGDSTARIQNNYFYQNRTAGTGLAGIAQPTIQDNIFEQTGSAVLVSDRAAPLIANNRMTQNQNGMVFQGSARPIVRNNSVEGNRQHALVAKDISRPDLGTAANPGGNFFRNNGLYDVNVKATNQVISAVGNEWLNTVGTLNTTLSKPVSSYSANAFPIPSALSSNPSAELPRPMQIVQIAMPPAQFQQTTPLQSVNSIQVTSIPQPSSQPLSVTPIIVNSPPIRVSPVARPSAVDAPNQPPARMQSASAIAPPFLPIAPQSAITAPPLETFPLSPSSSIQFVRSPSLAKPSTLKPVQRNQLALSPPIATIPIAIPVPPPETITLRPVLETKSSRSIKAMIEIPKGAKNTSTTLLPVPSANVPLGKIGDMPSVYSMRGVFQAAPGQNTTFFSSNLKASNIRFRVLVNAEQQTEQAQVLALVPDAFLITSKGKMMMQVGAFSDLAKAEQLMQTFASQGFASTIEHINQ